ncbi:Gfo/Idh/MocA family protein [Deinococcus arenicola]|uniref:Gfo/Idh/MocA family oxidoreductase n=1 Tax=Deinococcus arenicola TaxID=2994950 RepID=A0ABU4DQR5_9DEIO|nr:Gfo/Idh/MocA family oxidoreductase [Deinococcus sp. ZS9-10]MDV6374225.1 Gfo/Idh/MocA family oxidoreductase [Deinococcus sp. ZS9-10]
MSTSEPTADRSGTGLRWGLLGAARIAQALIPAIRASGGEVVALGVRDPSSGRARAFAQEWNVPLVGGYQEVLDADLDAIYNPLPNDLHLPWSLNAMRAGKHVLTEKPLVLNAAEAQQLADAAAETQRVLLEAFAYRFHPHISRLRELVGGGELGELRAARLSFGFSMNNPEDFRWEASKGGGALYDVGTYAVNLIRLLLGEPTAAVARARWTEGGAAGGVDVGLSGVLEYPEALATLDCGFDWSDQPSQHLNLVGTRGTLDMPGVFHSNTHSPVKFTVTTAAGVHEEEFPPFNAYAAMVEHFQQVVLGEEMAMYPPEDSVKHARVLDALFAAARTGTRTEVG